MKHQTGFQTSKAARLTRFATLALAFISLAGCNTLSRLSDVGDGPELSNIQNPIAHKNYQPVSLPMPSPQPIEANPNSLWRAGARAFFKDHRAKVVGDVVTVTVSLADSAKFENKTAVRNSQPMYFGISIDRDTIAMCSRQKNLW